ncbi:hypothetical protein ABZ615_32230 [Streptomyces sp. NPDC007325]|uniref:hypothetical protein n=1 Tax=Streptomyces sp. NPDC007325 TaxID=3154588 RepID=UPI003400E833
MDVERVIDELYGLRPSEFTAARDAYAAEARRAKDTRAAKTIAALRRPPLAVWAANLLARERPEEAERFLGLGEALREAHRTLDGEALREASRQRNRLVAALVRTTAGLAEEAGQHPSDAVLGDVETILHAVLALPDVADPWAKGRLPAMPESAVGFPAAPEGTPARPPAAARARKAPEEPAPARARKTPEAPAAARARKTSEAAAAARAEKARKAAAEAEATLVRRERERDTAREAEAAATEAARKAADRLRRAERERAEAEEAAAEADRAAAEAGTALRTADHALDEARAASERAEEKARRAEV